jgi:hypothetical protein
MEGLRAAIAVLAALVLAWCGGSEEEADVKASIDCLLTTRAEAGLIEPA